MQLHLTGCRACGLAYEDLQAEWPGAARVPVAPAPSSPSVLAAAPKALLEALRGLATFEMPTPVALTARGDAATVQEPSQTRWDAAMEAYRAGDHAAAATELEAALAAGDDDPATRHYLGACLLALGRPEDAVPHLREAASRERKLPGYGVLLAKALLLAGDGEAAEKELARVARLPGRHRAEVKELAKRVREALAGTEDSD